MCINTVGSTLALAPGPIGPIAPAPIPAANQQSLEPPTSPTSVAKPSVQWTAARDARYVATSLIAADIVAAWKATGVTSVLPALDATPAQWLLQPSIDPWNLVRYGPSGFGAYVRIPFESEHASAEEFDAVGAATLILVAHTTTPARGYAAVWEGWAGKAGPAAPVVPIPHRTMLLFTGAIEALRETPELAWYGKVERPGQAPHLLWPEDQAWCLACEVDEEIEFTVGCSEQASEALIRALPVAVRRIHYAEPAPLYREDG